MTEIQDQKPNQTNDHDSDEFAAHLEKILGQWRNEIITSVHAQIGQVKEDFKSLQSPAQEKGKKEEPAVIALKEELDNLKKALKKEKLSSKVSELSQKYNAHSDLLDLKLSRENIIESEGQLFVQKEDGSASSLDSYIETLIKSDDGVKFVKQQRPNPSPLEGFGGPGKEITGRDFDIKSALFNGLS